MMRIATKVGTCRRQAWSRGRVVLAALLLAGSVPGCSADGLVGENALPSGVIDPASVETPEGAVAAYRGALAHFRGAVGGGGPDFRPSFIPTGALLTDELSMLATPIGVFAGGGATLTDSRFLPQHTDPRQDDNSTTVAYAGLQRTRGHAQQARGLLQTYAPDRKALVGHLHAVQGYAEVYLADLYCSGIPLSTVDFAGDYTLAPGSSTEEVYTRALARFDTAITLAADSARVLGLAQVGRGRALLALGRYAEAAQAVAAVPDAFRYELVFEDALDKAVVFVEDLAPTPHGGLDNNPTMADREGGTGLDFIGSGDPRIEFFATGQNTYGHTQFLPSKYPVDGIALVPIASGVEARLIEAEAALQAGDPGTWLAKLNHLRQTAIAPALPDTTEPGTDEARVDLMFRERAFWLYLTGHRQGDLRRLIRQYGRAPDTVYPTGSYRGGRGGYGGDVTAPVPAEEAAYNPHYTGCIDRNA